MNKLATLALAACATFGMSAQAATVIDNFDVAQTFLTDTSTNSAGVASEVSGATSNIIGGYRDLYVTKAAGDFDGDLGGSVFVSGSQLRMSSDEDQTMIAIVRWDGDSTGNSMNGLGLTSAIGSINEIGLGGENLDIAGIAFQVSAGSDLSFSIEFQVYTDAGNWSSLTKSNLSSIENFAFDDFVSQAGTGADFANVGAIQMIINYSSMTPNADLRIDIIQAVPEPTSLALVGLAMLGLGAARRKSAGK